jgi:hypothetical protein
MSDENKTTLRLEIDKTIQPEQFEPIKIMVDVTETFYWKDREDRDKKMQSHIEKMTEDFVKTFDSVAKTIGEEKRCIGRVITGGDVPNPSSKKDTTSVDKDEEWDFN